MKCIYRYIVFNVSLIKNRPRKKHPSSTNIKNACIYQRHSLYIAVGLDVGDHEVN